VHTQGHAVLNYFLLKNKSNQTFGIPILAGATLPGLPLCVLYFYQRHVLGISDHVIWTQTYFSKGIWQDSIDLFHSFPILGLGLGVCAFLRSRLGCVFFLSMLLHSVFDFPFHNADAHRHFFPFSDWKWHSPISYWDPAHYGKIFVLAEFLVVLSMTIMIWRKGASLSGKVGLIVANLLYLLPLAYCLSHP